MTLQAHAHIIKAVYALLGIAPEKVTHEMRVFAAQVMCEMGVSHEVSGSRQLKSAAVMIRQLCCY